MNGHNYLRKLLKMVGEGKVPPNADIAHIHIVHDDWCGIQEDGCCNCDPDIKYELPATLEGFHKNRLDKNNPREVAFSEVWKRRNFKMESLIPDYTERDARVAATIIQWLGSNVGMNFLCDVFQKEPKVKEWFGVSQTATIPQKENL